MRIIIYNDKGIKVGEINQWSYVIIGRKNVMVIYQGRKRIYPEPDYPF